MINFKKVETPLSPHSLSPNHDFYLDVGEGETYLDKDTYVPVATMLLKLHLPIWGQFDGHPYSKEEIQKMYKRLVGDMAEVIHSQLEEFVKKVAPFRAGEDFSK